MATIRQNADGSLGVISESEGIEVNRIGGPKTPTAATGYTHRQENTAKITLGVATGALTQSLVQWQPPNNAEDVIITLVYVSVQTTGAANLECGTAISNSIGSSNLIDALPLSAPGLFDNITDKGSSGKSRQYLTAGSFVVASPDATPAGLVGSMYITYIKA